MTSRPRSTARVAVMSDPLRSDASTTITVHPKAANNHVPQIGQIDPETGGQLHGRRATRPENSRPPRPFAGTREGCPESSEPVANPQTRPTRRGGASEPS